MGKRLLISGAGSGASNNLIRSLRAGDPSFVVIGCHDDQFVLKNSAAERNYVIPPAGGTGWLPALRRVVEIERVDLILPTSDRDVSVLSRARTHLRGHLFLPSPSLIRTCADKYQLTSRLRAEGIPAPATYPVRRLGELDAIFRRLGRGRRAWCRVRTGAGALGAIPVDDPAQARAWIAYWRDMRGIPVTSFTISEYLPGRDFGCQSVWKDGQLVLIKTYERLSYLGSGSQPALVSSVAALAKTIFDRRIVDTCSSAVRMLDSRACGVFSADLKEDAAGVPCLTEINAGRFSSATNIFDLTGKQNMALTYVHLALDQPVEIRNEYDVAENWYMLRDIDTPPRLFHADEFFDRIEDVRTGPHGRTSP
jgi:carbamoyl-phosphate synthase large subunit